MSGVEFTITLRIRNIPQEFRVILKLEDVDFVLTKKSDKLLFGETGDFRTVSDGYIIVRIVTQSHHFPRKRRSLRVIHVRIIKDFTWHID
jgi:hypothetical protein